jgi:Undecaprenyl-phosphate glucose phosphotransferase
MTSPSPLPAKKSPSAPNDSRKARVRWPTNFMPAMSPLHLALGVQVFDGLIILLSGFLTYTLAVAPAEGWRPDFLLAVPAFTFLALLGIHSFAAYRIQHLRIAVKQVWRPVLGCLTAALAVLALLFFQKIGAEVSRLWVLSWLLLSIILLTLQRFILQRFIKRWTKDGRLARRAVIVGGGAPAAKLIMALENTQDSETKILGIFDDRGSDRVEIIPGYPILGSFEDLISFARLHNIDLLIVALPIAAENRLLELLRMLWVLPVDIRLGGHMTLLRFTPRSYSYIGTVPFLDIFDKPLSDGSVALKWLFDKFAGMSMLLILSPVMLLTAILIKLTSRGPIFFRQRRYGFNNQLIEVFKFRSMYADAEDQQAQKLVTKDDPRVTPFGRFIRKTSLDELPQLLNVVFKGNLSLVGPRPHAMAAKASNELYQNVVDGYFARHKVKPGITGWAQVSGWRGETDTAQKIQKRVEHDLYYIDNWSIWFDIYIMLMTPIALLTDSERAY